MSSPAFVVRSLEDRSEVRRVPLPPPFTVREADGVLAPLLRMTDTARFYVDAGEVYAWLEAQA